jgi:hypothetical protein
MDRPIRKVKQTGKGRMDRKLGDIKGKPQGVTKSEFHAILDKASQPVKREAESDSGKSET